MFGDELGEPGTLSFCCDGVRGDVEYEEDELELDPRVLLYAPERGGILIDEDMFNRRVGSRWSTGFKSIFVFVCLVTVVTLFWLLFVLVEVSKAAGEKRDVVMYDEEESELG